MSLGRIGKVSLDNNAGNIDLIADLSGFYTAGYDCPFFPRDPHRVLDTRDGTGGATGPVGPAGEIELRPLHGPAGPRGGGSSREYGPVTVTR